MMNKSKFIKTLVGQGMILSVMVALVIGAASAAIGEKALYSEQVRVEVTGQIEQVEVTHTPEPEIEVIEPSKTTTKTLTSTPNPSKTATLTKSPTKTAESSPTSTLKPTQEETVVTDQVCKPPNGWVQYQVQPGENLYRISLTFNTTVEELKTANCMGDSIVIVSGQLLWVPNVATSTPKATLTPTGTKTNVPKRTSTATITTMPTLEDTPTQEITPTETSP